MALGCALSLVHVENDLLVHARVGKLGSLDHHGCVGTRSQLCKDHASATQKRSKHADLGFWISKLTLDISDAKGLEDVFCAKIGTLA